MFLATLLGTAALQGEQQTPPTITNFNPKTGPPGTEVTVTGTNFNNNQSPYGPIIHLGSVGFAYADLVNTSGTELKFRVPWSWSPAPADKITINFDNQDASADPKVLSTADFTPISLSITNFNPKTGPPGTEVTVTGAGFNVALSAGIQSAWEQNAIHLGSTGTVLATQVNADGTELKFYVPTTWSAGSAGLITINGYFTIPTASGVISTDSFTPIPLTITDFDHKTGLPGTAVTVTGTGFDIRSNGAHNFVHLGSSAFAQAHEVSSDGTQLAFYVPPEWSPASADKITINFDYQDVSADPKVVSTASFTPIPFTVTGFSPKTGGPGTVITVTGTGFHGSDPNNVIRLLGGGEEYSFAHHRNAAGTEIKFRVPPAWSGLSAAPLVINFSWASSSEEPKLVSGSDFTPVELPSITNFNPKTGPAGTEVTVTGTGFSTNPNNLGVVHLGPAGFVRVHAVNADGTELKFRVPGKWSAEIATPITINYASSFLASPRIVSTAKFTPQGDYISITDFNPKRGVSGTEITITGTGFDIRPEENRVHFLDFNFFIRPYEVNADGTELKLRLSNPFLRDKPLGGSTRLRINFSSTDKEEHPRATSTASFAQIPLSITGFSPTTGGPDTEVTITGTGFGILSYETSNNVYLGTGGRSSVSAHYVNSTGTELKFIVPTSWTGLPAGPINVNFDALNAPVALPRATSAEDFIPVPAPTITDFNPKKGLPGTEVTITGIGFDPDPQANYIYLTGTWPIRSFSAHGANTLGTELKFYVPGAWSGSSAGPIRVTLSESPLSFPRANSASDFTPAGAPTITDFNPKTGSPGDEIIITGTGFAKGTALSFAGINIVKFSSQDASACREAHAVNPAGTEIRVRVPQGAKTGPISVFIGGGVGVLSTASFTFVEGTLPLLSDRSYTYSKTESDGRYLKKSDYEPPVTGLEETYVQKTYIEELDIKSLREEMVNLVNDLAAVKRQVLGGVSPTELGSSVRLEQTISVRPNPATHYLEIDTPEDSYLKIIDVAGRVLRAERIVGGSHRISIRELPVGSYLLLLQIGSQATSYTFVKG
ncbi:MAG: IPT/TIG domain-containing protein [Cytophagales bacterium]|nr:IPT/TIG domain-containing protein [Cytophagales bacterium]